MGIAAFHADLIVREHKFRPLPPTVHLLGRQTVQVPFEHLLGLFRQNGVDPLPVDIQIDRATHVAVMSGQEFITDTTFFGMLGVKEVRAIDHSDFEGADIILDLNLPIPEELAGQVRFLYGGSVLDNVFDPATYVKNVGRLLAPGGRLIDQNLGSFHLHPYSVVSPAWYFDYFTLNRFDDCKIYLIHAGPVTHVYGLTVDPGDPFICDFGNVGNGWPLGVVLIAEKGAASTWQRVPSQDQYRDAGEWAEYRNHLGRISASPRMYNVYGAPTPEDLAKLPLRWSRSFRFLGTTKPGGEPQFDGTLPAPAQTGIKIIEASYGLNLVGQKLLAPGLLPLCAGNVTDQLAALFNADSGGELTVDVALLGDPAPQMGKDLRVSYIYLHDPERRLREVYIPAEAHGTRLAIPPLGG
jgi:hypothetical protein